MKKPFLLGISGGTGSGKSVLAESCRRLMPAAVLVETDWYYKDRSRVKGRARLRLNFDHPTAVDVTRLCRDLKNLVSGRVVEAPQYDFVTHRRTKRTVRLQPRPLIIVEGLFVLHESRIRRLLDYSVFLDLPADLRLMQRIRRDQSVRRLSLKEILRLYKTFARPMHERFVQPSRRWATEVWTELPDEKRIRNLMRKLKAKMN